MIVVAPRTHQARARTRVAAAAIVALLALSATMAHATAWHVSPTGNDADAGTAAQPFATIQHAITASADGDSVMLADGEYSGPGNRDIDMQGKALRVASISMDPLLCVVNCADPSLTPHLGFIFNGYFNDRPELAGLTVTGATAIGAEQGAIQVPNDVASAITGAAPVLRLVRIVNNSGNGFYVGSNRTVFSAYDCDFSDNTGHGGTTRGSLSHRGEFFDCRFERNGGAGLQYGAASQGPAAVPVTRCRFVGNALDGFLGWLSSAQYVEFDECEFTGNGGNGLTYRYTGRVTRSLLADNDGWGLAHLFSAADPGVLTVDDCEVTGNLLGGIQGATAYTMSNTGGASIQATIVANNGGPGIFGLANTTLNSITDCVVAGNGGPGVILKPGVNVTYPFATESRFTIAGTTITGNTGPGLSCRYTTGQVAPLDQLFIDVDHSVICFQDTAATFVGPLPHSLAVACTDIYGNTTGDWVGPLAALAGLDGNLTADPQFCDPSNGDYHLQADSPLAAANNACGTIGRFEVNCPADPLLPFEPVVADVPADQGGALRVTWRPHPDDAPSAAAPITAYDVQRLAAPEWQTVATTAAAAADTYSIVIATPDVLTVGQPEVWSRYRLVARTAAPAVFFESPVDSAYSTDDLAPPKPAASLVDGADFRYIVWPQPGIPDLASACVYRGTESGFTPGAPLACPADFFTETHLAWYFYRVQFTDAHGNVSEFSDELHGQFPTSVGALPHALVLEQNVPNPFNPQTNIRFSLPGEASVTGRIFDVSGRLVRTLLDNAPLAAGPHDVAWDGCDDGGRKLPSGGYHFVLESGGERRALRMTLLR